MPEHCSHRRLPRARVDPIDDPGTALALIRHAITWPPRDETIAVLLDEHRRGRSLFVVGQTTEPDAVVDVADVLGVSAQAGNGPAAVILASVRPTGEVVAGDIDRWLELSDVSERAGIELVEWFVVARSGVSCPRDQLGAAPRWRRSAPPRQRPTDSGARPG